MTTVEMSASEASDLAGSLRGIVDDHPSGDPRWTLQDCADRLAAAPGGPGRAGFVVILSATSWYAVSGRIGSAGLLTDMAAALRAAVATLDPAPCSHGDAHPWAVTGQRDRPASLTALFDPEPPPSPEALALWSCPRDLADLTEECLSDFGDWRTMHMYG
ncbi:hypothetical protein EDD29_6780 [Actinocorallia herbida]|uniref:Uncharacterized protein n=1 Tax=Actinocorallia herbida TaxID=58109 RepID=A0A3N1D6D4_9ACTN|nr:hypothetical protein [Actinocorallia herbida]ROO89093.1 hypothetical protein EDD29_6780 [Actinocorallia herbida]